MTSRTDELLDDLIKGKSVEELIGKEGVLNQLRKRLMERAMEGELTDHLGYSKYSPDGKNTGNSRNGKSSKTIITDDGKQDISVPRDRQGSFSPQIVKKGQRRFTGFDEKIVSMYALGMSTRDIGKHLQEIYGVEVSLSEEIALNPTSFRNAIEKGSIGSPISLRTISWYSAFFVKSSHVAIN
jgi:transposase-like protein